MNIATRNELATLLFDEKKNIPEGVYLKMMNILGEKKTAPDFDKVKCIKMKSHLFCYNQEWEKPKKGRKIPKEFEAKNMNIQVKIQIFQVIDAEEEIWDEINKIISKSALKSIYGLHLNYKKDCCGNCHYCYPPSQPDLFWRPVEIEFLY